MKRFILPAMATHSPTLRIAAMVLGIICAFTYAFFGHLLPEVKESLFSQRREMAKRLTEPVWSSMSARQEEVERGEISLDEAKRKTIELFRAIRYGEDEKDYYWIIDTEPRLLMHPYRTDLEGKNVGRYQDPEGKFIFTQMVEIASSSEGGGFLEYQWQWKDDRTLIKPKTSYVQYFKPWGWIIGTGLYVDDINRDISALQNDLILTVVLILVATIAGIGLFAYMTILSKKSLEQSQQDAQINFERFEALFNLLPFACLISDFKGRAVLPNQYYCDEFGLSLDEIKGKTPEELNRFTDANLLPSLLNEITATGNLTAKEILVNTPRGQRWILLYGRTIEWNREKALLTVSVDITEKKEAVYELERNEKRYRTIFESDSQAFYLMTDVYVDCNQRACDIWGCTRDDILGRSPLDFSPEYQPNGRPSSEMGREFFNAAQGGETQRFFWQHRHKDGALIDCNISLAPIEIQGDRLLLATVTDITEQKKMERLLVRERDFSKSLIAESPAFIVVLSRDGQILHANHSLCLATGNREEDVIGKDYLQLFIPPEYHQKVSDQMAKHLQAPETEFSSWQEISPIRTKAGDTLTIQWSGRVVNQHPEYGTVFLGVGIDMTETRKLEDQLRHVQKMESIGELAGGIAHDFNNVLAGIIGAAELCTLKLSKGESPKRHMQMILDNAERAASLTGKLLSFARKQPAASTVVDMLRPLRESISLLKSTIDKRITLHAEIPDEKIPVVGDLSHLQSAFLNLLINASHAMPEGGDIFVSVTRLELNEQACHASGADISPGPFVGIEIRDTGCGISRENISRIFEPFFTTKEQGKGTGLGLAAVLGTIQQHKGNVTVYSEVGSGTSVHIWLPVADEATIANPAFNEEFAYGSGTILLVDDEVVMRATATAILEELGYNVLVAEDGAQGLALFTQQAENIDLVILDMVMPKMNGRDCFLAMKKVRPDVRVILSSGFSREEEVQSMKAAGLQGFIHKPFRAAVLSQAVKQVLSESGNPAHSKNTRTHTILVADDEKELRANLVESLEMFGYNVLQATNGKEAAACYREKARDIDLVIMDLRMPVMSGIEATRSIREIDPEACVLISTGFADEEIMKQVAEAGALGVLRKPVSAIELSDRVAAILATQKKGTSA